MVFLFQGCHMSGMRQGKVRKFYQKSRKIAMFEEESEKIEIHLNPTCYFKHPGETENMLK